MRIAIIQGAFLPVPAIQGGAVEKIWYQIGQEFAGLGHEVTHISRSHPDLPNNEETKGVNYVRIPGYDTPASLLKLKYLDFLYSFRAVKMIPGDVDVIVTNTFWSPLLFNGNHRKKTYVDVQRVPKGQMKYYVKAGVGLLRGCSPAICEAIREEIPETFHSKVSYIPNPIPFDIKAFPVRREKVVLFVGRLHPEKGVHVLINAFNKLDPAVRNGWKLIIVGPYEYKEGGGGEAYYNELLNLATHSTIEFAGPVYNENELSTYYARASVFCYPAQQGSGDAAPVAPREAMAYGAVPVVSKLDCFNDFIVDGENGLCYNNEANDQENELMQSLSQLMTDEEYLKRLSKAAKRVSVNYSLSIVAKRFLGDFNKIAV
jgi:glycosyltransferase involved in cell wall biosynthesis